MKTVAFGFITLLIGIFASYFVIRSSTPTAPEWEAEINNNITKLQSLEENVEYKVTIPALTGVPANLIRYVGMVAVKTIDSQGSDQWRFIGDFRPIRENIEILPSSETLYEGIITNGVNAGGTFTSFATELSSEELAEVVITNDLIVQHAKPNEIDWATLRQIPREPETQYWFVEGAILTSTTYREYQKVKGNVKITGAAVGANGEVYASRQGFQTDRQLHLQLLDLFALQPSEGSTESNTISSILGKIGTSKLAPAEAEQLTNYLQERSSDELPESLPAELEPLGSINEIGKVVSETSLQSVSVLKQQTSNGCWATVATIIHNWRNGQQLNVTEFLETLEPKWLKIYEQDKGLKEAEKKAFVLDAGMSFDYGQTYTPAGLATLLKEKGPLWFTLDKFYNTHANVVIGTFQTNKDRVYITYIDPGIGKVYNETYESFMKRFETYGFLVNDISFEQVVSGELTPIQVAYAQAE